MAINRYCWRCKAVMPILTETEWEIIYPVLLQDKEFIIAKRRENNSSISLNINGIKNKSIDEIICQLQKEMIENVYVPLTKNEPIKSNVFKNNSLLPEGNIYGFVFNQSGVVIHDFLVDNTNAINKSKGNLNITIHDIKMENYFIY